MKANLFAIMFGLLSSFGAVAAGHGTSGEKETLAANNGADPCWTKGHKIACYVVGDAQYHAPKGSSQNLEFLKAHKDDKQAWGAFCMGYGRMMGAIKQLTWMNGEGFLSTDMAVEYDDLSGATHVAKTFCDPALDGPGGGHVPSDDNFVAMGKNLELINRKLKKMSDSCSR